jgi:hypothetical protein
MNNASNLLSLLALLTIVADSADREDAEDTAAFWWNGADATRTYLPDGREFDRAAF